jgi:hypothetical protein
MRAILNMLRVVAVAGASILPADAARACSEPLCSPPVRLFEPDAYVPGNLVYFELRSSQPGELSLETASGTKIPASIRQIGTARVFAPDVPIPPDTKVRLNYVAVCAGVPADTANARSYTFTTQEPAEVAGARIDAPTQRERGFHRYSSLDDERAFVRLFTAVPASIRHLVDSWGEVDGMRVRLGADVQVGLTLYGSCNLAHRISADSCGMHEVFKPGKHKLVVHHAIVGDLISLPDVETPFELSCEGALKGTAVPS